MSRPALSKVADQKAIIADQIRRLCRAMGREATARGGLPLETLPLENLVKMRNALLQPAPSGQPGTNWQPFSREGSLMSV